jgi:hypothetical protein
LTADNQKEDLNNNSSGRISLMRMSREDSIDGENFLSLDVTCMDDTVMTLKFDRNTKTFDICTDLAK